MTAIRRSSGLVRAVPAAGAALVVAVLLAIGDACASGGAGARAGATDGAGDVREETPGAGIAGAAQTSTTRSAGGTPSAPGPGPDTSASAGVDPRDFPLAAPGVVDEDTAETVGAAPVPTWDDASRASAVAAAVAVLTAFARPDLGHEAWWAALQPGLTAAARQDYVWVDPANIPARAVTGPGVLTDEASAYVAQVVVPTDAGDYTVVLSRADAASPWLAERLLPGTGG